MRFTLLTLMVLASGCGYLVDDSEICNSVQTQGYSHCVITDRHEISPHMMGGCGQDDKVAADVSAVNPAGRQVNITVCCGWPFKGCTIRSR